MPRSSARPIASGRWAPWVTHTPPARSSSPVDRIAAGGRARARIPLGTAGTLVFLGPLSLALLRRRSRLDLAFAAAAGVGVILLTGGPSGGSPAGVAFGFGAAASVAASILIARRVGADTDGLDGLALSILVAAVITLPVGVTTALGGLDPSDVAIVTVIGVLGIAIPYGVEFSALRRVGVRTYSILLSLDPAVAALAGLLLLLQTLGLDELVGIALVMAASIAAIATAAPDRSTDHGLR